MALQKNTFRLAGGLKITNHEPVDERILLPDGIESVSAITSDDIPTYYPGLVASTPTGKLFILTGGTPTDVASWVDITGEGVAPIASDILLGKNLIYSGQTIATSGETITDAFDAVVGQMVDNERVVSAALNDIEGDITTLEGSVEDINTTIGTLIAKDNQLQNDINSATAATSNLSASTVYIAENYAKKEDITNVYKVKGSVQTYTELVAISAKTEGDVWNVVEASGTTPAGTNYVWTGTEWDALGGTIDLSSYALTSQLLQSVEESSSSAVTGYITGITLNGTTGLTLDRGTNIKVESATNADTATTLSGFGVEANTSLTPTAGSVVGILSKSSNKIQYKLVDSINSASTAASADTLKDFTVTHTSGPQDEQSVVCDIEKSDTTNEVFYKTTNKIYSASTADNATVAASADVANSATTATQDTEGRNIANTFALLDQYPAAPTLPKVNLAVAATPAFPTVAKVGETLTATSVSFTATTIAGSFNEAAALSPKTSVEYTPSSLAVGITGSTDSTIHTYDTSTTPFVVTAGTISDSFSVFQDTSHVAIPNLVYGANNLSLNAIYGYDHPTNSPKTLFGVTTTKTGKTASEGTATWSSGSVTSTTKSITVYGAYPVKTNMNSATTNVPGGGTTGSGNTITFATTALTQNVTNTEYVLYNPQKTIYFTFPPAAAATYKYYMIAFPSGLTLGENAILKYNDLAHVYDGEVTYTETTSGAYKIIKIEAPSETSTVKYQLILP